MCGVGCVSDVKEYRGKLKGVQELVEIGVESTLFDTAEVMLGWIGYVRFARTRTCALIMLLILVTRCH